tara:strand:- start:6 stop:149 length:144 start_codon:yes stop_codon:yes gene_type:complete
MYTTGMGMLLICHALTAQKIKYLILETGMGRHLMGKIQKYRGNNNGL